jgi:hypothetical protein
VIGITFDGARKPIRKIGYPENLVDRSRSNTMNQGIRAAAVTLLAAYNAGPAFAQISAADTCEAKFATYYGAGGASATSIGKTLKTLSSKTHEMAKASAAPFFASTKNGIGKMPDYKGRLTDEQINNVILYVRALQM